MLLSFLLLVPAAALAQRVGKGEGCSKDNARLQIGTYQFFSGCSTKTHCNASSLCDDKKCRREDFPLGYAPGDTLPPRCPRGEFCPDEGDGCQPWLPVDSPCQLNRDDQCQAPENFRDLTDRTSRGTNFNGSVCIQNKCMWSNVTIGLPCINENTAYIVYGAEEEFINIVSRGNCILGTYCDSGQKICMQNKDFGVSCTADKECTSYNCGASGKCEKSVESTTDIAVWVYVVVAIGIVAGAIGTLVLMFLFHKRTRDAERVKRVQYWREQKSFRDNLERMRETAETVTANHQSLNSRRNSFSSDEAHASSSGQFGQHGGSGLRSEYSDSTVDQYVNGGRYEVHHADEGARYRSQGKGRF